jgi:murein DD-endopeptidase MepM/ murein hydrolase activator NlpD
VKALEVRSALLWDQPTRYVWAAMAANLSSFRLLATGLMAAMAVQAGATDELPDGNSAAFHDRMMAWSSQAETPAPVVQPRTTTPPHSEGRLPRLSSRFGYRSDPFHGTPRMHSGIDIPGPSGTPIHASAGGTVAFAGWAGGYGRMIEIRHGNGLSTRYAHLSRILVTPGAAVNGGQTIALMGSSGRSTGSHLHFEVRSRGKASNPLAYFGAPIASSRYATPNSTLPPEPHISQFAQARAAAGGHTEKF